MKSKYLLSLSCVGMNFKRERHRERDEVMCSEKKHHSKAYSLTKREFIWVQRQISCSALIRISENSKIPQAQD